VWQTAHEGSDSPCYEQALAVSTSCQPGFLQRAALQARTYPRTGISNACSGSAQTMPSEAKWVPMRGGCHVRMTVPSCGGAVKYVQMTGDVSRTICGPLMRYSTACSGRSCGRTGNRYEETKWTWASCAVSHRLAILSSNSHSCWRGRTHKVVRHLRAGVTAAGIVGLIHAVHDKQWYATTVRAIRMIRFCGWQSRMRETLETGVGCRARSSASRPAPSVHGPRTILGQYDRNSSEGR
jgi:hypothetical protein